MRTALLAFVLVVSSQSVRAATAYEALRVLGKQRGEAVLDKVAEVRGVRGAPQPRDWKITVKDATARSGAKEFDVQGTRLLGERSPTGRTAGSPMNMSQLNLDSDGAHQIAEREARKVGFAYDHADYTLRAGTHGGTPVWEIRLVDASNGNVATINLAATTGKILGTEGLASRRRNTVATPPLPPVQPPPSEPYRQPPVGDGYDGVSEPASTGAAPLGIRVNRFFNRVGRHMERRFNQIGDGVHNLFTGDRRNTAGPHGSSAQEDPRPARRSSIDEDYTRPSRVRD